MNPVLTLPLTARLSPTSTQKTKAQTWTWLTNVLAVQERDLKSVIAAPKAVP